MSLGTGALTVGREPERLRIRNDSLSDWSARISSKMPAWDAILCKSQDAQKAPAVTPQITYAWEGEADRIGLQFNFA